MTDKKTHWKKLVNPDYIGAYSLNPGEDLTVTIRSVGRQMVAQAGGKKEECTVAQLVGQKPLILNATNSKTISKLYGPYIEDWAGKQITLYASMTQLKGEPVECLRIRDRVSKPAKQALSDERFARALASVKAGTFTKEALLNDFALTDEQAEQVNAIALEQPAQETAQ